jgi:hypothetical protein
MGLLYDVAVVATCDVTSVIYGVTAVDSKMSPLR